MLPFLSFLSCLSLWLFGLGVLISYIMRWWPGDQILSVRFINYFMPWLLIVLMPGFVMAWFADHKWLAVTLLTPIILISLTYLPLFLKCSQTNVTHGFTLKVMSYNVWSKNSNMSAAVKLIREEIPDILLLQELGYDSMQFLLNDLNDLYPEKRLHFDYIPKMNQAIISKFPIEPIGSEREKGRAQMVLVETPVSKVAVFNIHSYNFNWLRRHRQMEALLKEDIANTQYPIILGGDFNTSDQTQTCRMVKRFLKNAHWESGCGFGFTYPSSVFRFKGRYSLPAIIRIDHIFFSNKFSIKSAHTLKTSGGSDHYPVIAELVIN